MEVGGSANIAKKKPSPFGLGKPMTEHLITDISYRTDAPEPISAFVGREYDTLRHVVWSPIRETSFAWREVFDAGLLRQMMHNRIRPFDWKKAEAQHRNFRQVLEDHGAIVHEPDFIREIFSQYGTRDIGFVIDDLFVAARPRRQYRQNEQIGMRPIRSRLPKVGWLDSGSVEGGDVMLDEGIVMVGQSEESDAKGVDALRYLLEQQKIDREVVPIHFSHRGVIHLDCKLAVVGPRLALAQISAFAPASLKFLESRFELVPVTDTEQRDVQINVVPLGGGKTIVKESARRVAEALAQHGLTPVPVPYDDVTTLPGSFRCTTLPLVRSPTMGSTT